MRKLIVLAMLPLLACGTLAAESVLFEAIPSQGTSGLVSYNATLAGGYTLGTVDWSGLATPIESYTYGSELRCDIAGPLGDTTLTLGSGSTYSPSTLFEGLSYYFSGLGDPVGDWTFDFYESYDDGGDALPDATWDSLTFNFNDYVPPEPPDSIPVAVPSFSTGTLGDDEVHWYTFTLGGATPDFSVDTLDCAIDTELGLFDDAGTLLAQNDDWYGLRVLQSKIEMGLDAGTYYIAVSTYNTTFGEPWTATSTGPGGDYTLNITPEPASLLLLALAGLALRRR